MESFTSFYSLRLLIDSSPIICTLIATCIRGNQLVQQSMNLAHSLQQMTPALQSVYGWIIVLQISQLILNPHTHGRSFFLAASLTLTLNSILDPILNIVLFMIIQTLYCAYVELSMCESKVANTVWLNNETSVAKYVYSMMTYSVYKMACSFSWIMSMMTQLARVAFIGYCSTFDLGTPQHTFSLQSSCYPTLLLSDLIMLCIKTPK